MKQLQDNIVKIKSRPLSETLAHLDKRLARELGLMLKAAPPTREKAHQLVRLLQEERDDSDSNLRIKIFSYFTVPFERRTPGEFQRQFGVRPYPWLHKQFILNFSNAHFQDSTLIRAARLLRYQTAHILGAPAELNSISIIFTALSRLMRPVGLQPKIGLRLIDFLKAWQVVARRNWGNRYDGFFKTLTEQMVHPTMPTHPQHPVFAELTQADVEWLRDLLLAVKAQKPLPPYPLARGPSHGATLKIERLVQGHNRARLKFGQTPELLAIQSAIARESLRLLNLTGQASVVENCELHAGRVG